MSKVPVSSEPISNGNREGRLFALKTRLKKKKRRKDLEQLRRNVLAAKRNIKRQSLQNRRTISNKLPKNSLQKTLNMFAEVRHDNENKTQGLVDRKSGKKSKGKTICARLLPEPVIGIFKNGVKGKDVRREVVKNFPLYGMNKAQLHAEVFGLPNDEKTYSSSNEMSLNNRNYSDNSDRNERSKDKRDFYSISHHNSQLFDVIKDHSTFNNSNSPKLKSNSMKMKSCGEMRQMTTPKVSGNVQRADKYKRRVLKSSYDDGDYETTTPARIETQHFFQNPLEADYSSMQEELPTNAITNNMRSIKRWGISPAFCYDEFSKMVEEKFVPCLPQADVSDPLMCIRATLVARYAEAREKQIHTNNNNEDSCTSCSPVDDGIPISNQSSTVHNNQNNSWTITRIPPQSNEKEFNFLQSPNINRDNEINLMNRGKTNTNEFLRKFEEEEIESQQYIMRQREKSPNSNWIIHPTLSSGGRAVKEKQEDYVRSKAKKIPTLLRRSTSGPGISVDMNMSEFCGIDNMTGFQGTQEKSKEFRKFRNHLLDGNTNFCLPPNILANRRDNKQSDNIYANSDISGVYEFSMPDNEFVKARNENSKHYSDRVNIPKCHHDEKVVTPLLQIDFDDIYERNYHNIYPIDIKAHDHVLHSNIRSPPRSKTMYCSNIVPMRNINSNSLSNGNYIKSDQKNLPIPAMDEFQNSSVPFWHAPDFNADIKMNFISSNAENTLHDHAHYSDTNLQLNNTVLHGFKDLSFEEDKLDRASSMNDQCRYIIGNDQQSARSDSNLYQPSKYYAVSKGSDDERVPRRVPMYINVQKPQSLSKMISEELMCRVNVLKQTGKCVAAPHALNFETDTRRVSNRRARNKKNTNVYPQKFNRDFSASSRNEVEVPSKLIAKMTMPTVRSQKSFNAKHVSFQSDACEILLDDGRIGLFVPRKCC